MLGDIRCFVSLEFTTESKRIKPVEMVFFKKAAFVLMVVLLLETNASQHIVNEKEPFIIKCYSETTQSPLIQVKSAQWRYRWNINNIITPNIRLATFAIGNFIGVGTWDVTKKLNLLCSCKGVCEFIPTRAEFGDCEYEMALDVKYECVDENHCFKT